MTYRWVIVFFTVIFIVGLSFANDRSPLECAYTHFVYRGVTYDAIPNTPDVGLDISDMADYYFMISCMFDTGGVDIGFAIDSSGSMYGAIGSVRATIGSLADGLEAAGYDYRLGACPYADSTRGMWDFDPTTPGYQMTSSISAFHAKLMTCNASGGGDTPEEYLDALACLMRHYDWRTLAMKIIIGFTDAVFCELGNPCSDCRSNEIKENILAELLSGRFILFNITSNPPAWGSCVPTAPYHLNWYQSSAPATGGQWFNMATTPWTTIFSAVVEFVRNYQSITVAVVNTTPDTVYNVTGEFIAGPCFVVLETPSPISAIPPGRTGIFVWRLEPFSDECPLDSTSDFCFTTVFHSTNRAGIPHPDFIAGGCVWFGEDCACEGTFASKDFPPDDIITSCADQCVVYSMYSECPFDTASFIFKVNRGTGWVMYAWNRDGVIIDGDSMFYWCPPESALFFRHGDTVRHELFILDDISGMPLHERPYGRFIVDLRPPVFDTPYPPDGALIGGPPAVVRVNVDDNIAGVDRTRGWWMSINGVRLPTGYPYLSFDGSTIRLNVIDTVSALFPPGETTFVCVGAQDKPDLCAPNASQICWSFVIDYLDFDLPEMTVSPGETISIPIIALNPNRFNLHNFNISFRYDPTILNIIGASRSGSCLPAGWTVSATATAGIASVSGYGSSALLPVDTLVMVRAVVRTDAPGAGFSLLTYTSLLLDSGYVGYRIIDNGWILVRWNPEIWTHDLVFDSDTRPENTILTFGIMPGGSNLYDPGMDIQIVPPPMSRTDAYFPLSDPSYPYITRLARDIRSPEPLPITWHIVTRGEPGTLTWSSFGLPKGIITLNGMFEMHYYSSYRYAANETLTITYDRPDPTMNSVDLCVGWNLIGFPVIPTVPVVPNVLPPVLYEIYGYNNETYSYFGTNSPEAGRGYWGFSTSAGNYPIGGVPVTSYAYPLRPGWNLIGCTNLIDATYTTSPAGILVGSLTAWNCSGTYVPATTISAGHGYWALSNSFGVLIVPAGGSVKNLAPEWSANISFNGESFSFGVGPLEASLGIPPVGPSGERIPHTGAFIYDNYEMKSLFTPTASGWDFKANENGILTFDPQGCPNMKIAINGKIYEARTTTAFSLEKGDIATFSIATPTPKNYAVRVQPNPANSAFTVSVDIPDKDKVKIALYDMLGNRVGIVSDGELPAGTHRFIWSAGDQPSGIYLVRAEWTGGNDVKRVVLLK